MASKEELKAKVEEAQAALRPGVAAAAADARRRGITDSFSVMDYLLRREDKKYAAGPAFMAYPVAPTFVNLVAGISFREWAFTAIGSAVMYGIGLRYVGALSAPALSGHRLGKWLALPAVFIGFTSGLKASYYRHQGLLPNGMPPVYEGYFEESNTAPHYVKHYVPGKDLPRMS